MKKLLSLLAAAALLLCLTGAAAFADELPGYANPYQSIEGVTSTGSQDTYGETATIVDYTGRVSTLDPADSYAVGSVYVTKSPTGETVDKGGSATFTAYASSGAAPTWRLVSSDTLETIYAAGANQYFNDIKVTGAYSNRLTIENIPDSMNGWQVVAAFDDGLGGHVFSAGARITVRGSTANGTTTDKNPNGRSVAIGGNGNAPSINGQPTGAELSSGKSTTLSVTAGTNDGGKLQYQWYVYAEPKPGEEPDPKAIAGATSASYTPGEIPGTRYYYCEVWSEKNGVKSATVNSDVVAVTYTTAATPAPTPIPSTNNTANTNTGTANTNTGTANTNNGTTNTNTGTTNTNTGTQPIVNAPTETEPSPTTEASPAPAQGVSASQVDTESRSSLPVILGAIAAVALAAGVGLLVLRRNAGQ